MNSDSKTPPEQKQEQQIAQFVLEEVISQRNTLMNEIASLNVQLKVAQARIRFLEQPEKPPEIPKEQTKGEE